MSKNLHIIGLPHTVVSLNYSTCAFTGKILRFPDMMNQYGWNIIEYSNEGSESKASRHVQILSADELKTLSLRRESGNDYTVDVRDNQPLKTLFYNRMYSELKKNVQAGDIVCHVFGPLKFLIPACPQAYHVESGIGYASYDGLQFRIFESNIWLHWHYGRNHLVNGSNYHWVCPNYYNLEDWKFNPTPENYILFFGRLVYNKGLNIIYEIAKVMPEKKFILCGQSNIPRDRIFENNLPNITFLEPVYGRDRSIMLGNASVVLCPTEFIEPQNGTSIESQLTGTPVVSSAFGAFLETIEDGVTGFRCNTLADYVEAINRAPSLNRNYISNRARRLYDLNVIGMQYNRIFKQITDLGGEGWYSPISRKFE